jgi:hypothetical protein
MISAFDDRAHPDARQGGQGLGTEPGAGDERIRAD